MALLDSRYIGMVDIPESREITARFVYNFFEPDERTDRSGKPRFHGIKNNQTQKLIDTRIMETRLPRFIEINFDPVDCGSANINDLGDQPSVLTDPAVKGKTCNEESLTTSRDTLYRYTDGSLRKRLTDKARQVANMLGAESSNVREQINVIKEKNDEISANHLESILSPENTPGVEYVNDVGDISEPKVFELASSLKLDSFLDRRLLRSSLAGNFTHESVLKTHNAKIAEKDAISFLPSCPNDSGKDSFEPTFEVIRMKKVGKPSDLIKTVTVGYIIERHEVDAFGNFIDTKKFLLDGAGSTSFIDTQIVYGSSYTYTVRTVALIESTIEKRTKTSSGYKNAYYEAWSLVSSRPSKKAFVKSIEHRPPLEPDGVFYRYNYDDGRGLVIRWQIPVGKQRDVKYFQIFRRKTIYDPFQCIAEIDFDDSTIKTTRREMVDSSNIFKFKAPTTTWIDHEFNRDSSYIYAVVALDAHGLTSGYSAQTLVTFNGPKNTIDLKNISRPGAPKQYPNFYIDPDLDDNIFVDSLTQDAMLSSHKRKIKIYFDPDTVEYTSSNGNTGKIVKTKNNDKGLYKIHLLNIDRQKSSVVELEIENLGSA